MYNPTARQANKKKLISTKSNTVRKYKINCAKFETTLQKKKKKEKKKKEKEKKENKTKHIFSVLIRNMLTHVMY